MSNTVAAAVIHGTATNATEITRVAVGAVIGRAAAAAATIRPRRVVESTRTGRTEIGAAAAENGVRVGTAGAGKARRVRKTNGSGITKVRRNAKNQIRKNRSRRSETGRRNAIEKGERPVLLVVEDFT